jgi:CDP-glucose 4,6-dehydratase
MLGARVHGYALEPPTDPALFEQLDLANRIEKHEIADVCNPDRVARSLEESEPDFVFHLAAQSLVRESYHSPRETFETNTIGTVNVLDALRRMNRRCVVIVVTTDKVYENREWVHAYRESDRLGGHDPYSASKAAAELVAASYRSSFFGSDSPVHLATARAGNVIGGGDWANDRIVPDCIRASRSGEAVEVRSPASIRPWQHVLEPLSGYLLLAQEIDSASATSNSFFSSSTSRLVSADLCAHLR